MGKKGFNWKARNTPQVVVDNTSTKKISVDIDHRPENYDECNALVLPNKKRGTKKKKEKESNVRLLSKKKRKQLEKVLEKKKNKLERSSLLEELAKVQVSNDELSQYVSITSVQTKGLKRHFQELNAGESKTQERVFDAEATKVVANAIKGSKRQRLSILHQEKAQQTSSDPNVVGFEESSDEESGSESDENDVEETEPVKEVENKETEDSKPDDEVKVVEDKPKVEEKKIDKLEQKKKVEQKILIKDSDRKPSVFVAVNRTAEVQKARLKLPVLAEEQVIVEAINDNPVVIITGETGSGKTTQVPQFLYEAGYAKDRIIGVTEPRRVAAMSMSKRIAEEMNLSTNEVSYLIRFEGNVTPDTKIKFMTDGVLLKEVQSDFLLTKYSVIILDEAHERSVYTDILIGLLSRIVPLRYKRNDPLKLVIMSATLRVEDFLNNEKLFKIQPPLITVDSRQFPVTIHFNRRTSQNYVIDAVKKAVKIHTRLPEGGILIFLTGQHEVNTVVRKLRRAFPYRKKKWMVDSKKLDKKLGGDPEADKNNHVDSAEDTDEEFNGEQILKRLKNKKKQEAIELPKIDLDNYAAVPTDDTHEDLFDEMNDENDDNLDEDEDEDEDILENISTSNSQPMWVLPLYSLLPAYKQARVFEPIPEGCRLCVVSTNVAETSLTIPNVKYVVDSGRCKSRLYDKVTGVSTFKVTYTSQASANQRAGRAGRVGPGHCYRLYSSAVFNDTFEKFSEPEIRRKPVDDLLLQMKVMSIDKVVNFPFPTSPGTVQLQVAEKRLCILGALDTPKNKRKDYCAKVTPLGKSISAFPVAPRFGKMLAISQRENLLKYTICMVSALSVQEVFVDNLGSEGSNKTKWQQLRRYWAGRGNSLLLGDLMVLIKAVGAAEYEGSKGNSIRFCEENGLRPKAIGEIRKLRQQLTNEIVLNIPQLDLTTDPNMPPPTDSEAKLLRQIVLAGMADQVAKKISPDEVKEGEDKAKYKHAYRALRMEDPIFMHSSSVLRKSNPEWVVYQEIYETNKMYMRGVTAIEPEWLPKFARALCRLSEPMENPPPRFDKATGKVFCHMTGTFGPAGWELPPVECEFPTNINGVRWFARFFLEGEVCPKLKKYTRSLITTPSVISKSWSKLLPRTEAMIKPLLAKGIISRDKLLETWKEDKEFLLKAYLTWLPESARSEVQLLWPPN